MEGNTQTTYWRYWGKARPQPEGAAQWHLLPYHALDVAAVGAQFLEGAPGFRRFWAQRLGLSAAAFVDACRFFLAMHDLGKFAGPFQAQRPDLLQRLQPDRTELKRYGPLHWHDSYGALLVADWEFFSPLPWFDALLSGADFEAAQCWFHSVTGHHGQPPRLQSHWRAHFSEQDATAARQFIDAAGQWLWPEPSRKEWQASRPGTRLDVYRSFSWWLAGLAVLADWLGSNTNYFRYRDTEGDLRDYWGRHALGQASQVLRDSGVLPCAGADLQVIQHLLPRIAGSVTPLQAKAESIPLAEAPQLFVLEDVTGAGKTEAAVILAHRLMAAGQAQGLYFALPTMATADQMYERIGEVYQRLFAPGAQPSLVLAHSAQQLSGVFRASVLPDGPAEPVQEQDETASQRCTAWLADSRKAALLAQVGVGTIDQALMAALPVKHQSLRLLGLFGKVLIVDEVHACDRYLFTLLKSLLQFHRASGGSAILLSATLPQQMRRELCAIYAPEALPRKQDFPLLTQATTQGIEEITLNTRPEVARRVTIQWLRSAQECQQVLLEAARQGRSVCWIRNTVRDAMASYAALRSAHPQTQLFHARFVLGDRLRIQSEALRRFGREGTAEDRAGQILVATQVVEQSLDLDFDLMVSDLAPMDLLIQRAGRVHRHTRGERGTPALLVFAPEAPADADAGWLGAELRSTGRVYPDLARLWLTADELTRRGGWRMPEDARPLIEAVYGPDACNRVPQGLHAVMNTEAGHRQAAASLGMLNALRLPGGYTDEGSGLSQWWSEAHTPTRLGDATVTLHLLRWVGGKLTDFDLDLDPRRAAGLSRVSVRAALVNESAEPDEPALSAALSAWQEQQGRAAKWVIPVPMRPCEGQWQGEATWTGEGKPSHSVHLHYSSTTGLHIERGSPQVLGKRT